MKKTFFLFLSLSLSALTMISCNSWEDENNNGGGPGEPTSKLLTEVVRTTGNLLGNQLYTYDAQKKLIKVMDYADSSDQTSYVETTYLYPAEGKVDVTEKTYQAGNLVMTNTVNFEVLTSTTAHALIQSDILGEVNSDITYSTPCGFSKIVNTIDVNGEPQTTIQTFEYFDGNCSVKDFLDGELELTTINDSKLSPRADPMIAALGVTQRVPIKIESPDGTIETITYQYNEEGYPLTAYHTFNEESGEQPFTEAFTYQ